LYLFLLTHLFIVICRVDNLPTGYVQIVVGSTPISLHIPSSGLPSDLQYAPTATTAALLYKNYGGQIPPPGDYDCQIKVMHLFHYLEEKK
jgi:hypothetical protein